MFYVKANDEIGLVTFRPDMGSWSYQFSTIDFSSILPFRVAPNSRSLAVGMLSGRNLKTVPDMGPDIAWFLKDGFKTGFTICMIVESNDGSIQALYGVEVINKTLSPFGFSIKMYNITSKLQSSKQVETPYLEDFSPNSGFQFTPPMTNLVPTYGDAPIGNELMFGLFSRTPKTKANGQYSGVNHFGFSRPLEGDSVLEARLLFIRYDRNISQRGESCNYLLSKEIYAKYR